MSCSHGAVAGSGSVERLEEEEPEADGVAERHERLGVELVR